MSIRPRSFTGLLLAGLLVVLAPLVGALLLSSVQVGRLAAHGEESVYRAVRMTHTVRNLIEQITTMERSARQYLVLKEPARLADYDRARGDYLKTLDEIRARRPAAEDWAELDELATLEQRLHEVLGSRPIDFAAGREAVGGFGRIATLSRSLLARENETMIRQVDRLRELAAAVRRQLFWQVLALVPTVVVLATAFILLVLRPLARIEQSVRRLGDGDLYAPIRVQGPSDIEALGERLEWLRTRLLDVEHEKRGFLRLVSHELKTPLAALREGTEILAERVIGPLNERQQEVVEILKSSSGRLQRQIEDLLAFSRAPDALAGPADLHSERLDQLVDEALDGHRMGIVARDLAVERRLVPVTVRGDRSRLRAIIDNLLSNAVKYSPAGGRLTIQVERDADRALLTVADQGPGIPEEERLRVFDVFFQGRIQPEGPVRGSGLGLAIVRECALAYGGSVAAETAPGGGACLRVSLPVEAGNP